MNGDCMACQRGQKHRATLHLSTRGCSREGVEDGVLEGRSGDKMGGGEVGGHLRDKAFQCVATRGCHGKTNTTRAELSGDIGFRTSFVKAFLEELVCLFLAAVLFFSLRAQPSKFLNHMVDDRFALRFVRRLFFPSHNEYYGNRLSAFVYSFYCTYSASVYLYI